MIKWTMEDTVVLVVSNNVYKKVKGIRQAYFVNPKNKNSLENAKRWAGENHEVYTLKNGGFKLKILVSAGSSSQGGKLSFWNCLIEKDDLECVVGINAEYLCSLLCHNVFHYGKCLDSVYLVRADGDVAAITERMPEYESAREYMALKESRSKNKTTKWIPGCNYITTTLDEIYVGQLYTPLSITDYTYHNINFVVDFNMKKHLIRHNYDKNKDNLFDSILDTDWLHSYRATINKCPLRQQGDFSVKVNEDFNSMFVNQVMDIADKRLIPNGKRTTFTFDAYDLCVVLQTFDGNISERAMRYFDIAIKNAERRSETGWYDYSVEYNGTIKKFRSFALILKNRFSMGDIYYDVIDGHFVFKCGDNYFDWIGIIEPKKPISGKVLTIMILYKQKEL